MSHLKVLYGRKCGTLVSWNNPMDRVMIGPCMLKETELEVNKVKHKLNITQDHQKSYANLKRKNKEYNVWDHVYLKVKPKIIYLKMGNCSNLSPIFYGPFEILDRVGPVSYEVTYHLV